MRDDTSEQYLRVEDVAEIRGVAPATIRSYAARNQMPPAQECPTCGTAPVWPTASVAEWVGAAASSDAPTRADTAPIAELERLLDDDEAQSCSVSVTWSVEAVGRRKQTKGEQCGRPTKTLVIVTCPTCGTSRKPICRRHLLMVRMGLFPVTCGPCGAEVAWKRY